MYNFTLKNGGVIDCDDMTVEVHEDDTRNRSDNTRLVVWTHVSGGGNVALEREYGSFETLTCPNKFEKNNSNLRSTSEILFDLVSFNFDNLANILTINVNDIFPCKIRLGIKQSPKDSMQITFLSVLVRALLTHYLETK